MPGVSRRHFFFGSLLAGAVPAAGFGSTPSLKLLGYKSPNEKLNIAAIGAGGKADSDIVGCESENIVALADPDEKRARRFAKSECAEVQRLPADARQGGQEHRRRHRRHARFHARHLRHVGHGARQARLRQKPLTRTVWEARELMHTAAEDTSRHADGQPGLLERRRRA